ncbi:hypothetical protein D3C76_1402450 [compost metagenome]
MAAVREYLDDGITLFDRAILDLVIADGNQSLLFDTLIQYKIVEIGRCDQRGNNDDRQGINEKQQGSFEHKPYILKKAHQ